MFDTARVGMQHYMIQPLDPALRPVMEALVKLGQLTAELLSERCHTRTLQDVHDQVKHLQELRYSTVAMKIRVCLSRQPVRPQGIVATVKCVKFW